MPYPYVVVVAGSELYGLGIVPFVFHLLSSSVPSILERSLLFHILRNAIQNRAFGFDGCGINGG